MPDWLTKARQTITRSPGQAEPEPFERPCVCGETVRGDRLPQAQQVPCPGCGREWFILPLDPYPWPKSRKAKTSFWSRLGSGGSSAEVATTAPAKGTDGAAPAARRPAPPQPKGRPLRDRAKQRLAAAKQAARERLKRAAKPLRLVGLGIVVLLLVTGAWTWHRSRIDAASATLVAVVPQAEKAIENSDPVTAERLLGQAVHAIDVLGTTDGTATRVRQRHRELVAINGLASATPYDLAAEAERLAVDPQRWTEKFAATYAGQWVILDVPLSPPEAPTPPDEPAGSDAKAAEPAAPTGKVVRLDLPLVAGKVPVRFEMDAALFRPLGAPKRAILAAQYDSWRLHGEGADATWVVRFRPDTAFLWSSPDLLAARGFDLDIPDDPARPLLAAQSKALGVPAAGVAKGEARESRE